MKELISILIPVYNAEETIMECLASVLRQDYEQFEVIIVDDGSTDSTPEIIKNLSMRENRVKVYTFPKNQGIVSTLNYGLTKCSAEWVARMDADDVCRPERLTVQMAYVKEHPEVDILGALVRIFRHDGTELTPGQEKYRDWSNRLLTDEDIKTNIFAESPIMHPTFFLRKDVFEKLGGYRNNPWAEDYDFLLRALVGGFCFGKVNQILVEKRDSPNRLARVDKRCKRKAMFQAKTHYFVQYAKEILSRSIVIVGSGNSGMLAKAALEGAGVKIACFADNGPSDVDRQKKGVPVYSFEETNLDQLFFKFENPYFILCVGLPDARISIESLLERRHLNVMADFIRFI